MKFIISFIFILSFCSITIGQGLHNADSIEIVNKIDDWNKGWKVKDYVLASKWYSDRAEFTNAFGHNKTGKTEIEGFMKEVFALPFVMAGDSKVAKQKFIQLDKNIVLVITTIERAGQKAPDGSSLGIRHTTHHRVFKKGEEWLIESHLISDARDTESSKH